MYARATITDITKVTPDHPHHKPHIRIEYTIKVYQSLPDDPRSRWVTENLLKAIKAITNLNLDHPGARKILIGQEVLVNLDQIFLDNKPYIKVSQTLSPSHKFDSPEE